MAAETERDDDVEAELAALYRERDRLSFAAPPTEIRRQCVRDHRARVDRLIARLEAAR